MKKILVVALLLPLCGCDAVVSREVNGPTFVRHEVDSCNKVSYCYTCAPGFDGKVTCGLKFSSFCPGQQNVTREYTPILEHHKSGSVTKTSDWKNLEETPCL